MQLAQTAAEVAEMCRPFQEKARDRLDKHVRQIQWIKARPKCLQDIVGLVPDLARVEDRLVTNNHVPLTYTVLAGPRFPLKSLLDSHLSDIQESE